LTNGLVMELGTRGWNAGTWGKVLTSANTTVYKQGVLAAVTNAWR
jgi:hypothetical protein